MDKLIKNVNCIYYTSIKLKTIKKYLGLEKIRKAGAYIWAQLPNTVFVRLVPAVGIELRTLYSTLNNLIEKSVFGNSQELKKSGISLLHYKQNYSLYHPTSIIHDKAKNFVHNLINLYLISLIPNSSQKLILNIVQS